MGGERMLQPCWYSNVRTNRDFLHIVSCFTISQLHREPFTHAFVCILWGPLARDGRSKVENNASVNKTTNALCFAKSKVLVSQQIVSESARNTYNGAPAFCARGLYC